MGWNEQEMEMQQLIAVISKKESEKKPRATDSDSTQSELDCESDSEQGIEEAELSPQRLAGMRGKLRQKVAAVAFAKAYLSNMRYCYLPLSSTNLIISSCRHKALGKFPEISPPVSLPSTFEDLGGWI